MTGKTDDLEKAIQTFADAVQLLATDFNTVSEALMSLTGIPIDEIFKEEEAFKIKCYDCHQIKDSTEFYKDASRANGRKGFCRDCDNERRRKRYAQYKKELAEIPFNERFKENAIKKGFYD